MKEVFIWGDKNKQFIEDMRWVGKHIVRQAVYKGEDVLIVIIPLKEWQDKCEGYPIYKEIQEGAVTKGGINVSV